MSLYAPITEKVFAALPNLRIVSVPLVGVDAIDTEAAARHGVWIAHIPDAWVSEVGVHAAAMALSLVRHCRSTTVRCANAAGTTRNPACCTAPMI